MKRIPLLNIILASLIALVSCSGTRTIDETIAEATEAADDGKYEAAVSMCAGILDSNDSTALTATQMCRMAMVYAQAADHDFQADENTASAARCFERALSQNPDSVYHFVTALSPQQTASALNVLFLISQKHLDISGLIDPEDPYGIITVDTIPEYHEH